MLYTQYPNRIEVTHPDGPHRDQTVQLPLMFATAKRRINQRYRPSFADRVAKGFTIRVILADEVVETIAPPCPHCNGTGLAASMDSDGQYDVEEFCPFCDAGQQAFDATPAHPLASYVAGRAF